MLTSLLSPVALLPALLLQDLPPASVPRDSIAPSPGAALGLGFARTGVSLGNAPRWNGVRISLRDQGVQEVGGLSLSFWKAGPNPAARFTGITVGIVGPEGATLRGIALGGIGVVATRDLIGISLAGGATVTGGSLAGLAAGGLAVVGLGHLRGAAIAGLGVVDRGGMDGVSVGGLAVVSGGAHRGVTIGGLGVATKATLAGLNLGGLGIVGRGRVVGLNAAGLAVVSGDEVLGVTVAGVAVSGTRRVGGITVAGLAVRSQQMVEGLTVAGVSVEAPALLGLSVAALNRIRGEQRGITVGLVNSAATLHGLQLGLLNHAGNNPALLRWLPLANFHP